MIGVDADMANMMGFGGFGGCGFADVSRYSPLAC